MSQLIVRQIEQKVVKKLKEAAGQHGVSMEEEHRRILRHALLGKSRKPRSFKMRSSPCLMSVAMMTCARPASGSPDRSMKGFLLDTNVISELRKGNRCDKSVRSWFETIPEDEFFLSVLVLGEIRRGIERIRVHDPSSARSLQKWLEEISTDFAERILDVDIAVADQWGRLGLQQPAPVLDALLAATALVHDLTVATRDGDGFKNTGARFIDPFIIEG